MVINQNKDISKHVEFISYTGKYPNLCGGELTLKIDDEEVKFGITIDAKTGEKIEDIYPIFWSSGGGIDKNYCAYQEEWIIDASELPEEYRKYAREIDEVFNTNVRHGCCGGCA